MRTRFTNIKIVNTYNHFPPTTPPSTPHSHSSDQFLLPPIWWPLSTSTSWVNTSHYDHSSKNLLLPPHWWRLLPSPLQWLPPTLTSPLTTSQSHHSGDLLQLYPLPSPLHFGEYIPLQIVLVISLYSISPTLIPKKTTFHSNPSYDQLPTYNGDHLLLPKLWWLYSTLNTPPPIGNFYTPSYTLTYYSLPSMFHPTIFILL